MVREFPFQLDTKFKIRYKYYTVLNKYHIEVPQNTYFSRKIRVIISEN